MKLWIPTLLLAISLPAFADLDQEYNSRIQEQAQQDAASARQRGADAFQARAAKAIVAKGKSRIVSAQVEQLDINSAEVQNCHAPAGDPRGDYGTLVVYYAQLANGLYCRFPAMTCGSEYANCTRQ